MISEKNVKIIFNTPSIKDQWNKLNVAFKNLFLSFLKSQGITEIYVNSAYRPKKDNSFHSVGMALDLHYIRYGKNKPIYFTLNVKEYSTEQDIEFYKNFRNYFDKYRIEYFSPSVISKYDIERKNNKTDSLDTGHLNHLHIAINPDPSAKIKVKIKRIFTDSIVPISVIGLFFFWYIKNGNIS